MCELGDRQGGSRTHLIPFCRCTPLEEEGNHHVVDGEEDTSHCDGEENGGQVSYLLRFRLHLMAL